MKAIETNYKGYRFRSRLEARWAVYFDALGLEWEYEPEGFDLGEYGWYLPDFWIAMHGGNWPAAGYWIEIKARGMLTSQEKEKAAALGTYRHTVIILEGNPWPGECACYKSTGDLSMKKVDAFLNGKGDPDGLQWYNPYPSGRALITYEDERYINANWERAAKKARSARFEHGESP